MKDFINEPGRGHVTNAARRCKAKYHRAANKANRQAARREIAERLQEMTEPEVD